MTTMLDELIASYRKRHGHGPAALLLRQRQRDRLAQELGVDPRALTHFRQYPLRIAS